MKPELMDNAPPGVISVPHPSGWMQLDIFTQWFEHFMQHSNPTRERLVLLVLDGRKTHTNNLAVIELARARNVHIVCLSPHCTHRLQPLDVTFTKPLMTYYTQEVVKWLRNHPGQVVTTFQIAGLFSAAYLRASTHVTAINGFRKTGLWPLDRDVLQDCDFAAPEPTDIPIPRLDDGQGESEGEGEDEHDSSDLDEADTNQTTANVTEESHDVVDPVITVQPSIPGSAEQHDHRHDHRAESVTCAPAETLCQSDFAAEPSTSTDGNVAITVISPIQKADRTERRPQSKSRGHTAVITSSPCKRRLLGKAAAMHGMKRMGPPRMFWGRI